MYVLVKDLRKLDNSGGIYKIFFWLQNRGQQLHNLMSFIITKTQAGRGVNLLLKKC